MLRKRLGQFVAALVALGLSLNITMFCDVTPSCQWMFTDLGFDYHWINYLAFALVCIDLWLLVRAINRAAT